MRKLFYVSIFIMCLFLSRIAIAQSESGVIYYQTTPSPYYSQPARGIDLDLYERVLKEKQDRYDQNSEKIHEAITDVQELLRRVKNDTAYDFFMHDLNDVITNLNSGKYDLANTTTYYSFKDYLDKLKYSIIDYLER